MAAGGGYPGHERGWWGVTKDELNRMFPNASQAFINANAISSIAGPWPNPIVECPARHESLAKDQGKEAATGRLHIRFVSVRKRLCDPDNLSVKWLLDCLRFIGAIQGDEPDKITLEVTQRKAVKGEQEYTEIEIT